jgi:hypothetical protein
MKIITVFHVPFAFGRGHRFWLLQKESAQNGDNYIIKGKAIPVPGHGGP